MKYLLKFLIETPRSTWKNITETEIKKLHLTFQKLFNVIDFKDVFKSTISFYQVLCPHVLFY